MLEESGKKQADSIHYWLVGACALLLLLSNFSPWLSIAGISSVSGAKTDYGMFIFVSVVLLTVYVVSGVVKDTGLFRYQKLIKILSLASVSLSLGCLMYFIIRLASIKEKYFPSQNSSTDLGDLGEFGEALQETLNSLTQALTPKVGSGLYLAFAVLTAVLVLLIFQLPKSRTIGQVENDELKN